MTAQLPEAYLQRMAALLEDEFPAFLASNDQPKTQGLRINTLKVTVDEFLRMSPFSLQPIPWTKTGFYYEEGDRPGKHPYYHGGLYYIQEPSAMAPVEQLDVQAGDKVLDLCAAPGGKTTQIAAKLGHSGVLVANDNSSERVKALVKNLELSGVRNALVLNELPSRLTGPFRNYFDKILIDAPCSGEGMFRKEEMMAKQWDAELIERCVVMQRDILREAAPLLKPGGRMVYSTCTFAPEEDEAMIASFLAAHPDFELVPVSTANGFASGRPDWIQQTNSLAAGLPKEQLQALQGSLRLWPHLVNGEGHFIAVLKKHEQFTETFVEGPPPKKASKPPVRMDLEPWRTFSSQHLTVPLSGVETVYGEHLYLTPEGVPDLSGVKVIRPGWYMGALRKNRFEPSHALAMGLYAKNAARVLQLRSDEQEAIRYLKGETLVIEEQRIQLQKADAVVKGWCLVCIDGFPVGWGKWQDGMLKNEYPVGWRWN